MLRAIHIGAVQLTCFSVGLLLIAIGFLGCDSTKKAPDLTINKDEQPFVFKAGGEALDYVLENAERMSSMNLMAAAGTAYRLDRLQDAGFLCYAAQIRAKYDANRYLPDFSDHNSRPGGIGIAWTMPLMGIPITSKLWLQPEDLAKVVERLEAWNIVEYPGYDPGWIFTKADVSPDLFANLKKGQIDYLAKQSTLINIPEYFEALKIEREIDALTPEKRNDKAVADRLARAMQIMLRIEKERNIKLHDDQEDHE